MESLHRKSQDGSSLMTGQSKHISGEPSREYVLLTAAHNEEANIERTILSLLSQRLLPKRWVIVSDCSSDRTDEIAQAYADRHDFIRFLRISRPPGRSFGAKVTALRSGNELLQDVASGFIGNLDADVSVGPSYFEDLIAHFEREPGLGLAAGFVYEKNGADFQSREKNRTYSVSHAAQLMRRECYDAIGGYAVLEFGGEDWHAQISARMQGWTVAAFPDQKILHHRPTGAGDRLTRHAFRQGRMDYAFGSDPSFEFLKCVRHYRDRPLIIGSIMRLSGFFWSYVSRDSRPVSREFIAFLQKEQKEKVREFLSEATHIFKR